MTRRGEIWWVSFAARVGEELGKRRPAVIVSNDQSNRFLERVQVVPLSSSKPDRIYDCEAVVEFKGKRSKAKADQITTVSKPRLGRRAVGRVSGAELTEIERAIRVQLGL